MKIYFVRHGESEANLLQEFSNHGDKHPLTDRGRQQAEALARDLMGIAFHRIFTSPLLRARETAQILSDALNVPTEINEALREADVGILEGRADPAAWAIFEQIHNAWRAGDLDVRLRGGESFNDIETRFVPFIERLTAEIEGNILLVGHGSLYRFMLPDLLINIDSEWAAPYPIGNTDFILAELHPQGLTCISWCGVTPPYNPACHSQH
jgi:broad specificity phosphatase PhoE